MHPMLKENVSLGTFQYEGSDETHYYVENAAGGEYEISRDIWIALLQADGAEPLNLPDNGQRLLPMLKERDLVQTSRFVRTGGIFNRFALFSTGDKLKKHRCVCKVINFFLPVVAILVFTIGVLLTKRNTPMTGYAFNKWLYYGLIIVSLALHEVGHLVAGVAYDYRIRNVGILLLGIIPIGAYVAHEEKQQISAAKRIQFALAGIEVNLLVAGICLLIAMLYYPLSYTIVSVANINVLLTGVNLLPATGLDGEAALSALLGVDSI